ncbi:hypothetical protein JCM11491_003218 [Sporobolomyces phaffii]
MSTATREVSPLQDTSKSVVALLLSLSPAYFLLGARSKLGIDNLHVGLIQVVLLLVLRSLLDVLPSFDRQTPAPATAPATPVSVEPSPGEAIPVVDRRAIRSRRTKLRLLPPPARPPPFPVEKLHETVANFVSTVEPSFLPHLAEVEVEGARPPQPTTTIPPASLSTWTRVYDDAASGITVLQHPAVKTLYGIGAEFPDVPLRKLYEVLVDLGSRATWDTMTTAADEVERFELAGVRANVSHMKMKGMPLVKAKDLVLLSVPGRLPTAEDEGASARGPVADKLRIYCASTSVEHARAPVSPAFNRMELTVSGFLIEEEGQGSRIVQITDLSGLGSWVPNAVFKTVTQTMLPKSLVKLGETARGPTKEADSWPPPLLGSVSVTPVPAEPDRFDDDDGSGSDSERSDYEEEEEGEGEANDAAAVSIPASASRDVYALLSQLRALTSRLSALESIVTQGGGGVEGVPMNRPWYSFGRSSSSSSSSRSSPDGRTGADLMTLSASKLSLLMTVGSAAGAAVALAAVSAWGRRRT